MSEARNLRLRVAGRAAVPPRRRAAHAERLGPAVGLRGHDEPHYPLDPPLVDVRALAKAPHATATAYSRNSLMRRFPNAEVGDYLHMLFTEQGEEGQSRLSPDVSWR